MYVRPFHPELALVGMRVVSQVISASSCERNWSAHGHIHSEIRNSLAPATTEKLVYIYSNRKAVAASARDDELKMFSWDNEDKSVCVAVAVTPRAGVALAASALAAVRMGGGGEGACSAQRAPGRRVRPVRARPAGSGPAGW
jgi:hypothetical protein